MATLSLLSWGLNWCSPIALHRQYSLSTTLVWPHSLCEAEVRIAVAISYYIDNNYSVSTTLVWPHSLYEAEVRIVLYRQNPCSELVKHVYYFDTDMSNQIKSNNFYWSKNPNKGLSSIQNMTNTTKTTLSTQYLIT